MADWVWVESPGTALSEEPRVRVSKFGDGFEQRSVDGINTQPQTWDYNSDEVDDAVAAEMIDFLRARGGVEAFDYVPLWATTAIRVKCPRWRRVLGSRVGTSSITATFEQVFEP